MEKNKLIFAAAVLFAVILFNRRGDIKAMITSRGVRNNNPGNIRLGQNWQGMASDQTDASFVVFTSPEYGIRAINHVLNTYASQGINTVESIISRWAPASDRNDTGAYINAVADFMGVSEGDALTSNNRQELIAAIIKHENGQQPYTQQQILDGINLG